MKLRVFLHGLHVGDLQRASGDWAFAFEPRYLALPTRPVLGRWFEDQDLATLRYRAPQGRLPPFFDNYLPELESPLREVLSRRAGVRSTRSGELLAALGEDLPGAAVVRQVEDDALSADEAPLVDARVPGDRRLRFSLAGMQLKFSVARSADRFTVPVTGLGGRWILKLPDRAFPGVPAHEWAVMQLAGRCGIRVPETALLPWRAVEGLPEELDFSEPESYVVRRFDRDEHGVRIHQEDFAQVLDRRATDKYDEEQSSPLSATYQSLGAIIQSACGDEDFIEYLRRLAFMVLIGNADAHLKNWSLYYPDPRRPRLAPAYDLVATIAYQPQDQLALRFFKKRAFADVDLGDFVRLAERASFDARRARELVAETVARFMETWTVASELPLTALARARIDAHLAALALRRV